MTFQWPLSPDLPATDDGSEPPQVYGSNQVEIAWTEVTALVSFLETLRGNGLAPARNPAEEALQAGAAPPGP